MYEIACFGNPLLDIIVRIEGNDLLEKYDIKPDDQKEISDEEMKNLYDDIEKLPKELNAGGCAQNTTRIFQWIVGEQKSSVFFGMVANDEQGNELRKLVNNDNVVTKYQIDDSHITGICIALVSDKYRALLVNISAAQYFNKEKLENDPESLEILMQTKLIYVEACFLPFRKQTAEFIEMFCAENKKLLAFNLSAVYLFEMDPDMIKHFAEKSHILFGNQQEFAALGKLMNIPAVEDVARELNKNFENCETPFGKIVVITNGDNDIKCVSHDNNLQCFSVRKAVNVVDTVSAGDAFVAGFLAAFLKNYNIETCIEWGKIAALEIIGQPGCRIPNYSADTIYKIC